MSKTCRYTMTTPTVLWICLVLLSGCSGKKNSENSSSDSFAAPPQSSYTVNLSPNQDEIVVQVSGRTLTRSALDSKVEEMIKGRKVPAQYQDSVRPRFEQEYVSAFVIRYVQLDEAIRLGITVTDEEVDQAIEASKKHLPPDKSIENILSEQHMTMDDLKKTFAEEIKVRKMLSDIAGKVPQVSDDVVKQQYAVVTNTPQKVQVRHVLIKCSPGATIEEKRAKFDAAKAARQRVIDGEDFAEVAKEVSECGSADKGGDLGIIARGQTVPPFEKAAFTQKLNEIGPVIQTQYGYHFIQVTERIMPEVEPFDEVKDKIAARLMAEARNNAVKDFTEDLLKKAKITAPKLTQRSVPPTSDPRSVTTPTAVITAAPPNTAGADHSGASK